MKKDCCLSTDSDWFRYRATAIIIENNCVLLASNEASDYFYSYEIDRLAFIHENHKVYPTFFAEKLKDIPERIEHIISKELTENTSLINNVKEQ